MKNSIVAKVKKMAVGLFAGALVVGALGGCGKTEEATPVSETSKSGVSFQVDYESFLQEEFNLIFADAQDGSYLQSMEVLERPGDWTWQEVLVQCGNTNVEEFVLAGMSFYEWESAEIGAAKLEYLSVEEGDTIYSVGIMECEDSHYGVLLYGNLGEEILLKTAGEIKADTEGFGFELSGLFQNVSFSNRGKSLESYKVQYFETQDQVKAYLSDAAGSLKIKQIQEGREIAIGDMTADAVGLGLDANGKVFFAGQGQGSVASYGLISLPEDKGLLLLEYTNRSREDSVETLPEHLEMLGRFF